MKSKFLYPTKRNFLIGILVSQIFPIILLSFVNKLDDFYGWLAIETVIISSLCTWRIKPDDELDEREMNIMFKWKSRTLDYCSAVILLPLVVMSIYPEILSWHLFIITSVPIFTLFILFSVLAKREMGYFFYNE